MKPHSDMSYICYKRVASSDFAEHIQYAHLEPASYNKSIEVAEENDTKLVPNHKRVTFDFAQQL